MFKVVFSLCVLVLVGQACADPIDTRQYGLLRPGMSQASVVSRVGEPDHVQALGSVTTVNRSFRSAGGLVIREQLREAWIYWGDRRTMTTRLIFANGMLVAKDKGR